MLKRAILSALVACSACGGGIDGSYAGQVSVTLKCGGTAGSPETIMESIAIVGNSVSSNTCKNVPGTLRGSTLLLQAGYSCGDDVTLRDGTLTLSGSGLAVSLNFDETIVLSGTMTSCLSSEDGTITAH